MITKQVKLFIVVGSINTLVYYLIYSFFLYIGMDYKLSVLLATILGVFFSFKTLGNFVFLNNSNKLLYKFILAYSLIYLLNVALIKLFYSIVFNYYLSGLISIIVCAFVSFFLNKYFVFSGQKASKLSDLE
ncbi:GtrA family protein [Candidatus Woesearchaeota archaeon]|jgi:putative flippase GtrA|nr:GtrA family protein [Candidatus Woesearchaeota archaeon]